MSRPEWTARGTSETIEVTRTGDEKGWGSKKHEKERKARSKSRTRRIKGTLRSRFGFPRCLVPPARQRENAMSAAVIVHINLGAEFVL